MEIAAATGEIHPRLKARCSEYKAINIDETFGFMAKEKIVASISEQPTLMLIKKL